MNEGEFNIDSEFEALLNGEIAVSEEVLKQRSYERKKLPFYVESVDPERTMLVEAFYDHYISLSSPEAIETVDDFLAATQVSREYVNEGDALNLDDEDTYDSGIVPTLNDLLSKDVERYEIMASGELQVSGEGLYLFVPDNENDADSEVLEDGATLIGDISQYAALPSIAYEDFLRMQEGEGSMWANRSDDPVESPSPWLLIKDAALYDANGVQQMEYDMVMVPLDYPSLHFKKVIRQGGAEQESPRVEHVPLSTHFTADFILTVCTDIENNLNYNRFHYDEFREEYELLRQDIGVYMMGVNTEKDIHLTAVEATLVDGTQASLDGQVVQYIEPTIVKYEDAWRVAHAFMMHTEDDGFNVAHVLPEHISKIDYLDEQ
ncbi:MAG: hypothetical protein ACREGE_02465 [Candidatus Microsaccharimonas sp.]